MINCANSSSLILPLIVDSDDKSIDDKIAIMLMSLINPDTDESNNACVMREMLFLTKHIIIIEIY